MRQKSNLSSARKGNLEEFISEREPLEADQSVFDRLMEAMARPVEKPSEEDQT